MPLDKKYETIYNKTKGGFMKRLIFLIILITALLCRGQFITSDNEFMGIIDMYHYDARIRGTIIQCSTSFLWNMYALNHSRLLFIKQGHNWSYGVSTVFGTNYILTRTVLRPVISYRHDSIMIGIIPVIGYRLFNDKVQDYNIDCNISATVFTRYLQSSVVFMRNLSHLKSYFINTFANEHYMFTVQASYDGHLGIGCSFAFELNDKMQCSGYCDTDYRLGVGCKIAVTMYDINYHLMYKHALGYSHYLSLQIVIPQNCSAANVDIPVYENNSITTPIHSEAFDLNNASLREIASIEGIGMKTALKIFHRRIILGKYSNYMQIDSIHGIGDKTLKTIEENTYLGE